MKEQILEGPSVIKMPDLWSVARWRRQIDGPRAGWRSLHDAFTAATVRHRDQVDELIPAHWRGVSAEQYQRHQQQLYISAEHVCVYGDEVSFSLEQIGHRLDDAAATLLKLFQEIAMRVPARRMPDLLVEFRVTSDLHMRMVQEAVAAARRVHHEVDATVAEGVTRIRHSTHKLIEHTGNGDQVTRFLPRAHAAVDVDGPAAPDPGRSDPGEHRR